MSVAVQSNSSDLAGTEVAALAIDLDPLQVQFAIRKAPKEHAKRRAMAQPSISAAPLPPAVIVPRFAGEPLEVDLEQPPHPRGSGDVWPPEARVQRDKTPRRLPAALAWTLLERDSTWTCDDQQAKAIVLPADALATIYDASIARITAANAASPKLSLVVPTYLSTRHRQELAAALQRRGHNVTLIRRCLCAARLWFEQPGRKALPPAPPADRPVIARVLTIHLGLVRWEAAIVELVETEQGRRRLRMADRCADLEPLPSYGLDLMQRLAARSLELSHRQATVGRVWELLWCTSWMRFAFALTRQEEVAPPPPVDLLAAHVCTVEFVRQQCRRASQHVFGSATDVPAMLTDFMPPCPQEPNMHHWLNACHQAAAKLPLLGTIVTGHMAAMPHDQTTTLAAHYANRIAPQAKAPFTEGIDWPAGSLPRGALR